MKSYYMILISGLLLTACRQEAAHHSNTKPRIDVIAKPSDFDIFKQTFDHYVKTVKEPDLNTDSTPAYEFRFFFLQPRWKGLFEFYKVNYTDSSLSVKQFAVKAPDGTGDNRLLSTKTIKMSKADLETLNALIEKSKFWKLETLITDPSYFDKETYMYEGKRVKGHKTIQYKVVKRYAPSDPDFIDMGQWLREKGKQESNHTLTH